MITNEHLDRIAEIFESVPDQQASGMESLTALRADLTALESLKKAGDETIFGLNTLWSEAKAEITALREQIAEMERESAKDEAESTKLLAYARTVSGRRDVHSIYEVLDQVAALGAALRDYRHWFDTCTRTGEANWEERAAMASDNLDAALSPTVRQPLWRWRVGRNVPINVYEGDIPVCQCQTAEYARQIVEAVNITLAEEKRDADHS